MTRVIVGFLVSAAALAQSPGGKVLIIGDSISMGYTEPVRTLLAAKATVERIPENGGPTSNGVAHIDQWLSNNQWDIISFNFGLHDLKLDDHGGHQVETPQYEDNLKTIVQKLRSHAKRLIWVTTTPVPTGKLNPKRDRADVVPYNNAAWRALEGKVDAVCDLYSAVLPREPELQQPENVHFTLPGYEFLAQQVAAAIEAQLSKP